MNRPSALDPTFPHLRPAKGLVLHALLMCRCHTYCLNLNRDQTKRNLIVARCGPVPAMLLESGGGTEP